MEAVFTDCGFRLRTIHVYRRDGADRFDHGSKSVLGDPRLLWRSGLQRGDAAVIEAREDDLGPLNLAGGDDREPEGCQVSQLLVILIGLLQVS